MNSSWRGTRYERTILLIAGCESRYWRFAKPWTSPQSLESPPWQSGGHGFDLDQKVRRLGQRFATIQSSRPVQLIDYGVELAFRPEAQGIDPRQLRALSKPFVASIRFDDANRVFRQ